MSMQRIDLTTETAEPDKKSRKSRKNPASLTNAEAEDQPAPMKERKPKKPKVEKEKRTNKSGSTIPFSSRPNQKTLERIERALGVGAGINHRLYLIDAKERQTLPDSSSSQTFTVLGATGNVYDVTISRHPHCTCPDHAKGNHCKHILFVMLRVLRLPSGNPIVWNKGLLTTEVEEALSRYGDIAQGVQVDGATAQRWQQAVGGSSQGIEGEPSEPSKPVRREVDGDCCICFEPMQAGGEALTWCATCGNNFHKVCFGRWADSKRRGGNDVTCTLCRQPFRDGDNPVAEKPPGPSPSGNPFQRQYLNLRGVNQQPDLDDLYGDNSLWIEASQGHISRRTAARTFRAGRGY